MKPDFGIKTIEVDGKVKLTCRYVAPGLTMQDLVKLYTDAEKQGNDLAGNPAEWGVVKGLNAVLDAVFAAIYDKTSEHES